MNNTTSKVNNLQVNCRFIAVGITGPLGSGKGTVAEILIKLAVDNGYYYIYESLSDEIRKELTKQNIEINRETQRDIANRYRNEFGTHIWAQLAATEILSQLQKSSGGRSILVIIDAIRNPGEVLELQRVFKTNFVLVGVIAPIDKLTENILHRNRPDESKKVINDNRELKTMLASEMGTGQPVYGHNVSKCLEMANLPLIENDGSLELLQQKVAILAKQSIFPKLELV